MHTHQTAGDIIRVFLCAFIFDIKLLIHNLCLTTIQNEDVRLSSAHHPQFKKNIQPIIVIIKCYYFHLFCCTSTTANDPVSASVSISPSFHSCCKHWLEKQHRKRIGQQIETNSAQHVHFRTCLSSSSSKRSAVNIMLILRAIDRQLEPT